MAKVFMTNKQLIQVNELLKQHLKVEGDFVFYENGWDDAKIAAQVANIENPITSVQVSNLRRDLFGNFKSPPKAETARESRLTLLENEVQRLKIDFSALAALHQRLCQNLSVNRVADVKHLASIQASTGNAADKH